MYKIHTHSIILITVVCSVILSLQGISQNVYTIPERSEINEKYKWDLTDLYSSDSTWEIDFKWVSINLKYINQYQDKLNESPEILYKFLDANNRINYKLNLLQTYANCLTQVDLRNPIASSLQTRINELRSKTNSTTSFFEPEILSMPENKLWLSFTTNSKLETYRYMFKKIIRNKPHTLIWEKEEIIALIAPMTNIPFKTYTMLSNNDFNHLKETYPKFANSSSPLYKNHKHILASLLNGEITVKRFYANVRNYNSALEAALYQDNTPLFVYNNLIDNVSKNNEQMQNWVNYKMKLFQNDSITYDEIIAKPIFSLNKEYLYEDSKLILENVLSKLGKDFNTVMQTAFTNRWIDVYKTKGKSNLSSTFFISNSHPYILLNWENKIQNLFELAGELGKAVCFNYASTTQAGNVSKPSELITNIPAYVNQILLLDYLIEHATNNEEKKFFIETYLNLIVGHFYNNTFLAEFERKLYEDAEKNKDISEQYLTETSQELLIKYYGPKLHFNDNTNYLWAMTPQFYFNFINYNYPIDFAVAMKLVADINKFGKPAVAVYIKLLKTSNVDFPINIINTYGIDIGSDLYITNVFDKFNQLIEELKKIQ